MGTRAGNRMSRRYPAKYAYSNKCQQNKGFFNLNGFLGVEGEWSIFDILFFLIYEKNVA
jgi:hypothetical protein